MDHQPGADALRPRILLVGTGHWANPQRDMINAEYDDMLAPRRQQEIQAVLDRLLPFQPTRVAVEELPEHAHDLNEQYRHYRAGLFTLTANERHQLGFRLAAACGHEQVYAIDWQGIIGWDRALDFAREHNQLALLEQETDSARQDTDGASTTVATTSVLDLLRQANDPVSLLNDHARYLHLALVGEGENYVGVEVISNWYGRNMRIFVNLVRITLSPEDRLLVVIGSGHVPLLTHFIGSSRRYVLEPIAPYLS